MAKIYVTQATGNGLSSETSIKYRAFTSADPRQAWDFDAEAWGVYGTVSEANSLSAEVPINVYDEFVINLPDEIHAVDAVIQVCTAAGQALFAVVKDAGNLHAYNPGLVPMTSGSRVKVLNSI